MTVKTYISCTPPMKICDIKVFVAPRHTSFKYQYSGSTSKPILEVPQVPNVHHSNDTTFWSCDLFRDFSVWKIFNYSCLRQKLFWFLWLLHSQLYVSEGCQILPIAPVKIRHRCTIHEIYSLMKISVQSLMLRSIDGTRPACINYWGGMLADVHDGPWCITAR